MIEINLNNLEGPIAIDYGLNRYTINKDDVIKLLKELGNGSISSQINSGIEFDDRKHIITDSVIRSFKTNRGGYTPYTIQTIATECLNGKTYNWIKKCKGKLISSNMLKCIYRDIQRCNSQKL